MWLIMIVSLAATQLTVPENIEAIHAGKELAGRLYAQYFPARLVRLSEDGERLQLSAMPEADAASACQ